MTEEAFSNPQRFEVKRDQQPTLRFTGWLLATGKFRRGYWIVHQALYRLNSGKYVYAEHRLFPPSHMAQVFERINVRELTNRFTIPLLEKAAERDLELANFIYEDIH